MENENFKMLEVKNVCKVYKTKGGTDTKALDGVSISFGETGLVFLLGKSGSGKSTLLNVCGGLDEPTSGEVIVKGKSSKDFTGADFDSYRNTFVGFVFQEYNILDEFNVEENIALALELQGKSKDREKIAKLLKDVDLEAFAKRKPRTLSGGQKQRIAIARALVKDPQIIMADEPTGALDSVTGKQVFDTLKKLSETRLVIVVSHDREFAEIYGDRIVELKDGQIISDVSKTNVPPEALDENVSVIGGNTLSIKSGANLTAANLKTIQEFIKKSEGDVIISKGEKEIENFRKANRLSASGTAEQFEDTAKNALSEKEYTKEESKFIRSRLPITKAFKIGASGLKLKPARLIFTIFLSFIAFTMFGLFSTLMLFDKTTVAAQSFADSDLTYLNVSKKYRTKNTSNSGETYYGTGDARFTEKELQNYKSAYGASTIGYYYARSMDIENVATKGDRYLSYYQARLTKFAFVPADHKLRKNGFIGEYPKTENEICVSNYMIDVLINSTFGKITVDENGSINNSSETVTVNSPNDAIGQYLSLELNYSTKVAFKITGVFDGGKIDSKYNKLKTASDADRSLFNSFLEYIDVDSIQLMALVSENFYDEYAEVFQDRGINDIEYFKYIQNDLTCKVANYEYDDQTGKYELKEDDNKGNSWFGCTVNVFGRENQLETRFIGSEKTTLSGNEIVIGLRRLFDIPDVQYKITNQLIDKINADTLDGVEKPDYSYEEYGENYQTLMQKEICRLADRYYVKNFDYLYRGYRDGFYYDKEEGESVTLSFAQRKQALERLLSNLREYLTSPLDLQIVIDNVIWKDMKIVGFYLDAEEVGVYYSQEFFDENLTLQSNGNPTWTSTTNYVKLHDEKYSGIMISYDGTTSTYKKLAKNVDVEKADDHDVFLYINNPLYESVESASYYAEMFSTIFLWTGVAFAVFSALLLFNFISMSISNKRKEIGILRAVGARGADVFKIFFVESGIIVTICTVLSLVGTYALCIVLNSVMKAEMGMAISLFSFGIVSVVMMIGIAIAVTLIGTFLPVYFASRKKPVDSIRAL